MGYCRNIEFEDKPDYGYLKELFKKAMEKGGIEMDYKYCWSNWFYIFIKEIAMVYKKVFSLCYKNRTSKSEDSFTFKL